VPVDQAPIRGSRRSNPAIYTGLLDRLVDSGKSVIVIAHRNIAELLGSSFRPGVAVAAAATAVGNGRRQHGQATHLRRQPIDRRRWSAQQ
jgi:hypothetical protein